MTSSKASSPTSPGTRADVERVSSDTPTASMAKVSIRNIFARPRRVVSSSGVDALHAYRANLDLVLDILERQGLEHFLIRSTPGTRPVLAVTEHVAADLLAHLVHGPVGPAYVSMPASPKARRVRRLSRRHLEAMAKKGFWTFTYWRNSVTGRSFGPKYACEIQVWDEEDGGLISRKRRPTRTGVITARGRARPRSAPAYGRDVRTYPPFDSPAIFEVGFPIDVVYMWVDGSDPEWRDRKARRLEELGHSGAAEALLESRFRQFDELRYSLRSVERYAEWVRNVFLVTDRQRPHWLTESGTNLKLVDHREILPASAMPTFNSHAITASLHRIPGISDQFLLFNDDVLLGRPVAPELFFQDNGVAKFFLSQTRITSEPARAHEQARVRSRELIQTATGLMPTHVMKHTPVAFNRQLLSDLEEEFAAEWRSTVHNTFRSPADIVPGYLHHYIGYARGLTMPSDLDYRYFPFPSERGMEALRRYQGKAAADVLCVNDLGEDDVGLDESQRWLTSTFEALYPHRSSYERAE